MIIYGKMCESSQANKMLYWQSLYAEASSWESWEEIIKIFMPTLKTESRNMTKRKMQEEPSLGIHLL